MTAIAGASMTTDVAGRLGAKPIITPDQIAPTNSAYRVRGVFNPGATVVGDEIVLLLRVAEDVPTREGRIAVPAIHHEGEVTVTDVFELDLDDPAVALRSDGTVVTDGVVRPTTLSHLRVARSRDGITFTVDETPLLVPETAGEAHGIEDARITANGDRFVVTYTARSADGRAVGLAETFDFETVHRLGLVFPAGNDSVSILPDRSGGLFRAIHSPTGSASASLWYAESPDLLHWGNHHCVLRPRCTQWEDDGIRAAAPPILTDDGWLQLYNAHGSDGRRSAWAVLLDRYDPTRVIAQGAEPLLMSDAPERGERTGRAAGAVTVTGAVERGDELFIYYGVDERVTSAAVTTTQAVLDNLR